MAVEDISANVSYPSVGIQILANLVKPGDRIEAVVLEGAERGPSVELSHRNALPDPWASFGKECRDGDVVRGTVREVLTNGVRVELRPGILGIIPAQDITLATSGAWVDVFWPGDFVEAEVIRLDVDRHRVWLSIGRRLRQLTLVDQVLGTLQGTAHVEDDIVAVLDEPRVRDWGTVVDLGGLSMILIVEDQEPLRLALAEWLQNHGCICQCAADVEGALRLCQDNEIGVILADLDLEDPTADGLHLIRRVRELGLSSSIAVMSGPDSLRDNLRILRDLRIDAMFSKPLDRDELLGFLSRLASGERPEPFLDESVASVPSEVMQFQRLASITLEPMVIEDRLQAALERLLVEMRVEYGIIFHLDSTSWVVSIVAQAGASSVNLHALPGLLESPVKDSILEAEIVYTNRATMSHYTRFRNLLDLLPFESCAGIPLRAGDRVEDALFLFDRAENAFGGFRLRDALALAAPLGILLERRILDQEIQAQGRMLLSGQLTAAFGHEVYNKLSALDVQLSNLGPSIERLLQAFPAHGAFQSFTELRQALDGITASASNLRNTVDGMRKLMESRDEEIAEANQIVRQCHAQVRTLARKAKVELRLELADTPLPVAVTATGLHQAFLNLMLNAIQHMELKSATRRVLTLTTSRHKCNGKFQGPCVQIRFKDTGPGIHRQLWEQVFGLGFTTRRGGSGLGLYIARSLVQSMGGRISVEESLVPTGTTFLVELPSA